jgi:hypothetical protein
LTEAFENARDIKNRKNIQARLWLCEQMKQKRASTSKHSQKAKEASEEEYAREQANRQKSKQATAGKAKRKS